MDNKEIKLAIMGAGRWGMNHVKTAYQLLGKNLVAVCDALPATEEKIRSISPDIYFTTNPEDIYKSSEINCVVVATPAETHFETAKELLLNGKHVLVEKPITLYTDEAKQLIEIADSVNKKLMVGHILLYHPAIIKIKQLIDEGKIGTLQYIYSNRLNLGAIRSEENILWSFAPHDISIIQYLTGTSPETVDAKGAAFVQSKIEDTTITYLSYPNNVHAHIFVSWLHPFKEQRLVITGSEGMFVFEDSAKSDKLKFYEKGFKVVDGSPQKFEHDYEVIAFEETQALAEEHKHFYNSILNDSTPLTDGRHALEVLDILEKATERIKQNQVV